MDKYAKEIVDFFQDELFRGLAFTETTRKRALDYTKFVLQDAFDAGFEEAQETVAEWHKPA